MIIRNSQGFRVIVTQTSAIVTEHSGVSACKTSWNFGQDYGLRPEELRPHDV